MKAIRKRATVEGVVRVTSQRIVQAIPGGVDARVVQVTVDDNGTGFPSEFPLFEPFYSTDPESTGLGLATVKELVEAHKGTIRAATTGSGASVSFELPLL